MAPGHPLAAGLATRLEATVRERASSSAQAGR
jgi:hypothetical protein